MSSKSTTRLFSLQALCATLLGLTAVPGLTSAPAQADVTTSSVHIWGSQVRARQCVSATCGLASQERLTNVTVQAFCLGRPRHRRLLLQPLLGPGHHAAGPLAGPGERRARQRRLQRRFGARRAGRDRLQSRVLRVPAVRGVRSGDRIRRSLSVPRTASGHRLPGQLTRETGLAITRRL